MKPKTATELAARLQELAQEVRRLHPDHRDPEAYHIRKDEIWRRLQGLARELEGVAA